MSTGELIVTACVIIIVIPPSKWPTLAHHVNQGLRLLQKLREQAIQFWQAQLALYQLAENEARAKPVDDNESKSDLIQSLAHTKNTEG